MTFPTDELHSEPPTETIPVQVVQVADEAGHDDSDYYSADDPDDDLVDDGFVDDGLTGPNRRSRMTVALFIAVLVAIGFLAGVLVGQGSASNTSQRGSAAPVSGTARPSGGAEAFGRIG